MILVKIFFLVFLVHSFSFGLPKEKLPTIADVRNV